MDSVSSTTSNAISRLENLVIEVAAMQKPYVEQICVACETPCCQRVRYLFNHKDILFLRLSGRNGVWRKRKAEKKGCCFLKPAGCILEPISRPFICHRYICIDLEKVMNRCDPKLIAALREKFKRIEILRSQIWTE
jgi:hypothetical protein